MFPLRLNPIQSVVKQTLFHVKQSVGPMWRLLSSRLFLAGDLQGQQMYVVIPGVADRECQKGLAATKFSCPPSAMQGNALYSEPIR